MPPSLHPGPRTQPVARAGGPCRTSRRRAGGGAVRRAIRAASSASAREQAGLFVDFSRQRLDEVALAKLFQLADLVGLRERIDAMWRGEHINTSEDRAVLHVALAAAARVPASAAPRSKRQ